MSCSQRRKNRARQTNFRTVRRSSRLGLYRNTERGMVAGVCAGLADYLAVDLKVVRILTVIAMLVFNWPMIIAYVVAVFVLDKRPADAAAAPRRLRRSEMDDDLEAEDAPLPPDMPEVVGEFDALEDRLQGLEAYLSSKRFELDREFRDLERA